MSRLCVSLVVLAMIGPDRSITALQRDTSDTPSAPTLRAHTYSIVARDPDTGELGVAVQSHWFSVGSVVAWAEAGVGAIATQALVDPGYGPQGLDLMRAGTAAPNALRKLLATDSERDVRQVAMIDARGRAAVHTGAHAIAAAGHQRGSQYSVQANLMSNDRIWPAMANAYERAEGDLAERLLAALDAAQAAGGDIRGKQSAALLIVKATSTDQPWPGGDRLYDIRVDDAEQPLEELRRLVRLQRAYNRANRGDELMANDKVDEALTEYAAAARLAPEIEELPFWQAVTLASTGRIDDALPIFEEVFARNPAWADVVTRLPAAKLLPDDPALMKRILSVRPKR